VSIEKVENKSGKKVEKDENFAEKVENVSIEKVKNKSGKKIQKR